MKLAKEMNMYKAVVGDQERKRECERGERKGKVDVNPIIIVVLFSGACTYTLFQNTHTHSAVCRVHRALQME